MRNNRYTSCDWLQNGIDFELNSIEICCFRCHSGGGRLLLSSIENGNIDYDMLLNSRLSYVEENKKGKVNSKCINCFNIKYSKIIIHVSNTLLFFKFFPIIRNKEK